ncbi:MAG: hypothetical protein WBP94_17970 [Rhodomicrobiaceae bacterium]
MFQVLILICAAGVSPPDCQKDTALDVFRGPVVSNEVMCGLHGQAYLAETSLAARGPGEYMKIKCLRSAVARARTAPAPSQEIRN